MPPDPIYSIWKSDLLHPATITYSHTKTNDQEATQDLWHLSSDPQHRQLSDQVPQALAYINKLQPKELNTD